MTYVDHLLLHEYQLARLKKRERERARQRKPLSTREQQWRAASKPKLAAEPMLELADCNHPFCHVGPCPTVRRA
eukprot:scaffold50807_cov28-Tisochrysis_lutea.AAC.3